MYAVSEKAFRHLFPERTVTILNLECLLAVPLLLRCHYAGGVFAFFFCFGGRFFLQRSFLDLENRVVSRFGESTESSRLLVSGVGAEGSSAGPYGWRILDAV